MIHRIEEKLNKERGCGVITILQHARSVVDVESAGFISFLRAHGLNSDVILRPVEEGHAAYMFCWLLCNNQIFLSRTEYDGDYKAEWMELLSYAGSRPLVYTNNRSLPLEDYAAFKSSITCNGNDTCFVVSGDLSTILIIVSDGYDEDNL